MIEVWYTILSFLPSLARIPSAPFFQPADSRIWLALSTLNSHFVFFEEKRAGAFRKFAVVIAVRP